MNKPVETINNMTLSALKYCIYDPTGNITALCEAGPDLSDRLSVAGKIMEKHPDVEQVGFVRKAAGEDGPADAVLDMAGGEFCGNASMCTAVWYALQKGDLTKIRTEEESLCQDNMSVRIKVSGAEGSVEVRILEHGNSCFRCEVRMPSGYSIVRQKVSFAGTEGEVPLVNMDGISHMIIEQDSEFSFLLKNRSVAQEAVVKWCREIGAPGLGLMFTEPAEAQDGGYVCRRKLTPLVYIPGSDTLYWEHSCASGSSAVCRYISAAENRDATIELMQPGGTLSVRSREAGSDLWLTGNVKIIGNPF